ncbi:hypothetical protein DTL70_28870 [Streptomyces diacarni]|uniref:Uncharacterized protein n=1 Tax=Streptomyces diacarni TaxID=2800381 RepID=A0A367EF17_9ACTN|nr:hypothetical protein DTL70_28870 [Streptomyces diacarni]
MQRRLLCQEGGRRPVGASGRRDDVHAQPRSRPDHGLQRAHDRTGRRTAGVAQGRVDQRVEVVDEHDEAGRHAVGTQG